MAVQQTRKSRAKRDMRRAHDFLAGATISVDSTSGEQHLRHRMTEKGFYRGRQVIASPVVAESTEE